MSKRNTKLGVMGMPAMMPGMIMTRNAHSIPGLPPQQGQYERRDITVRSFQLRADSINEDDRSVEAVIATEAPTMVLDMQRWEVVEEILVADGMRVASEDGQVPLLDTHNRHSVAMQLGSCRNIRAEGDLIIGRNFFSSVQAAQDCFTKIQEGHVRDNSVGYQVLNYVTIEAGGSENVNGRQYTASDKHPLRVTTEWVIKENSVCPIGADSNAKMREEPQTIDPNSTNTNQHRSNPTMNLTTEQRAFLVRCGMAADANDEQVRAFVGTLNETQRSEFAGMLNDAQRNDLGIEAPEPTPAPAPAAQTALTDEQRADIAAQVRAEQQRTIQAEQARVLAIRTEGASVNMSDAAINHCIDNNLDISAARQYFLEQVRTARPAVMGAPQVIVAGNEITRDHLAISLLMQGNCREDMLQNEYSEDLVQQTHERCRRLSVLDICRAALTLAGHDVPLDRGEMIRAGFATGALPVILGDVAHKMMLKGFTAAAATWEKWCTVKSVSDFRDHNLVRLNVNGGLEKIGNGGEIKHFERSEEARKHGADEYGKNIDITRQDMINDDVGAFLEMAEKIGVISQNGVSDLVYTVLMANVLNSSPSTKAMFSTTVHKDVNDNAIVNLQTGSALAIATLSAAIALFRKFREYNGNSISVDPAGLLVPPELEGLAHTLVSSELIVSGNTTGLTANNPNAHVALDVISESRLSNPNIANYSATSWYLVPPAGMLDVLSVSFLNGVRTPTLTPYTLTPDRSGAGWSTIFDYGADLTDIYAVKSEA